VLNFVFVYGSGNEICYLYAREDSFSCNTSNSLCEFNFQDSNEIHFRVKMTTQMGKLKKSYSERVVSFVGYFMIVFALSWK
jgi:Ubiquitin-like protein (sentrin)